MKKYLLQIALFFAIVAVVDFAAGKLFRYVQANKAGGRTGAEWYACRESNEDIVIMGSSRASHHYVPQILSDSLGMSCFNAGQDGNGIILQYGRWKMISERYTPKVLIYDVTPSFDLEQNDNMAYIDRLKPFCDDYDVKNFVTGIFPVERWKLYSQMYRYNYKFLEMISDCEKDKSNSRKGYIPLHGQMNKKVVEGRTVFNISRITYDETKLHYFECLILDCQKKNTKLIFVVSPYFKGGIYNKESFMPIIEMAEKYDVPFYYFNDSDFINHPGYYKDSHHLNDEGAEAFTVDFIHRIAS